jgi:diguanylate cyclase (GGDEF)-like protein
MTDLRDGAKGESRRLLTIVLVLGAVCALVTLPLGHSQPPVQVLGLAAAAGCLWSALVAFLGRPIAQRFRIAVAAVTQTYLAVQLGILFFTRPPAFGNGRALEAAVAWAPVVLITTWLLVEEAAFRRIAVAAYYLAVLVPAAVLWIARGSAAAPTALGPTAALVLGGAVVNVVLVELARQQEKSVESRAAQEVLERMAHTDALTELPNRRSLMAELNRETAVAARFGLPLAVIEFDLDHFKDVNDVYGHQTGDRVLVALARHVRRRLRATDVAGRMGGEEFLILAPGNSISEAARVAEEICESLRERPMAGDRAWITASFGVAVYESGDTAEAILARADAALYAAKRGGGNRVATANREAADARRATSPSRPS